MSSGTMHRYHTPVPVPHIVRATRLTVCCRITNRRLTASSSHQPAQVPAWITCVVPDTSLACAYVGARSSIGTTPAGVSVFMHTGLCDPVMLCMNCQPSTVFRMQSSV